VIRFGILGAGRVVQNRYVDVFNNELAAATVVAVCDTDKKKADKVSRQLGTIALYNPNDLFRNEEIDVILIATESGKHYLHSKMAIENGKNVIVEKPPTMFPEQALELKDLANNKKLMYAVVFQNRLNPAIQILKSAVDEGRFGKIVLSTIRLRWCRFQDYYDDEWHGTWEMDGGVINQQAIHHVDAMQWMCGEVDCICSKQVKILNKLEADDTTVAILKFKSGALGTIEATTAARQRDFEASISIVGEGGYTVIGGIALNRIDMWEFVNTQEEDAFIPEKYSQKVPTGYGLSHGPLLQDIVDRLSDGNYESPIAVESTVKTIEMVHGIYKSDEIGGWVDMGNKPVSERLGSKNAV